MLVGVKFSKPTLIRVLRHFNLSSNPPTRGRREERLIGKGRCGPLEQQFFRVIPVFRIPAVQSNRKHPYVNEYQQQFNPDETTRLRLRSDKKRLEYHQEKLLWHASLCEV